MYVGPGREPGEIIEIEMPETPEGALSLVETLRTIQDCASWVVLEHVEQVPAYQARKMRLRPQPPGSSPMADRLKLAGFEALRQARRPAPADAA
jgi:hypothetical protein